MDSIPSLRCANYTTQLVSSTNLQWVHLIPLLVSLMKILESWRSSWWRKLEPTQSQKDWKNSLVNTNECYTVLPAAIILSHAVTIWSQVACLFVIFYPFLLWMLWTLQENSSYTSRLKSVCIPGPTSLIRLHVRIIIALYSLKKCW